MKTIPQPQFALYDEQGIKFFVGNLIEALIVANYVFGIRMEKKEE